MVEKGASKEKIGLRGPMPPGVLFAVYDAVTGKPDYIPPEYSERTARLMSGYILDFYGYGFNGIGIQQKFVNYQRVFLEFTPIEVSKMIGH